MRTTAGTPTSVYCVDFISSWSCSITLSQRRTDFPGQRHYDILDHADVLLAGNPDDFFKADALENINKAVDQRFRALSTALNLRDLRRGMQGEQKVPNMLRSLGVIKPMLVDEINGGRNRVNHEDEFASHAR